MLTCRILVKVATDAAPVLLHVEVILVRRVFEEFSSPTGLAAPFVPGRPTLRLSNWLSDWLNRGLDRRLQVLVLGAIGSVLSCSFSTNIALSSKRTHSSRITRSTIVTVLVRILALISTLTLVCTSAISGAPFRTAFILASVWVAEFLDGPSVDVNVDTDDRNELFFFLFFSFFAFFAFFTFFTFFAFFAFFSIDFSVNLTFDNDLPIVYNCGNIKIFLFRRDLCGLFLLSIG